MGHMPNEIKHLHTIADEPPWFTVFFVYLKFSSCSGGRLTYAPSSSNTLNFGSSLQTVSFQKFKSLCKLSLVKAIFFQCFSLARSVYIVRFARLKHVLVVVCVCRYFYTMILFHLYFDFAGSEKRV